MFCENCGELLDDGVLFCTKCGQRVVQSEAAVSPESQTVQVPVMELADAKPKQPSKKQWIGIALAAVLVIVLAVVLANLKVVTNSVRKLVMSPQEYYAYIETREVEEMASGFVTSYDKSMGAYGNPSNQSLEYSVDLELGQMICDLLSTALGLEDASGLSKIGIDFNLSLEEKLFFGELAARLGSDRLISANAVADLEQKMVYARLPELSERYISADISENADQITEALEEYTKMAEAYPDGETLESIMNRYLVIMIDSFENVTEEKDVVTVEEFEQKCTKLYASMTEAEAVAMMERLMTEAKADEEFIDSMAKLVAYTEGTDEATVRATIMEGINEYLANVESLKAEADAAGKLSMTVWVNNKGEVIGREFAINETELMISYQMPKKGKEFGYQLLMGSDATVIEMVGAGSETASEMSGEFLIRMTSEETGAFKVATVTLEKLNLDKWEEGLAELSCRIRPDRELYSELGAGAAATLLVGYELIYEVNAEENESTGSISIANGEELLFKLDVFAKVDEAMDVTIPAESIAIEGDEDLMTWLATIDFDGFMENLKQSDMPAELLEIIEVYVDQFETMISYDEL